MAKNNNHYIAKIQTKDWLDDGHLNFIDLLSEKIDRKGQNTLFADRRIFPLEFENFLCDYIENDLGRYFTNNSNYDSKVHRALWLLTYLQSQKTITASYEGKKNIPIETWNAMVKLGSTKIGEYESIIESEVSLGKDILILESNFPLFYNDKGLFPYIFSVSKDQFIPKAILCSPISKTKVVAKVDKVDIENILKSHEKRPEVLRFSSISLNPKKVVFAKEEHYINFSLEKGQEALVVPFFKSHVEVGLDDDLVVFCVTNSITELTLLLEDLNDEIVHLKVLKPSDLKREVSFNGEKKSILSWIEKKHEETEDKVFLVG